MSILSLPRTLFGSNETTHIATLQTPVLNAVETSTGRSPFRGTTTVTIKQNGDRTVVVEFGRSHTVHSVTVYKVEGRVRLIQSPSCWVEIALTAWQEFLLQAEQSHQGCIGQILLMHQD